MSDGEEKLARGYQKTAYQEISEPLFLTSSFGFSNATEAADSFAATGNQGRFIYSRFSNPTTSCFTDRIAALEGAKFALATASGMAAILLTVMGICKKGDRILCGSNVFGATVKLLSDYMTKFGIDIDYICSSDTENWRQKASNDVALMLVETPSNPMQDVADIEKLSAIAKGVGAYLVVDNCLCAGYQKPLQWGADLVISSATKYLDGQGRVLGGVIAGNDKSLIDSLYALLRCGGPTISPFNSWIIAKSIDTLSLRMKAHSESALKIATWLEQHSSIKRVWHTALSSHPSHILAMKQQGGIGSGIITLDMVGDKKEAWQFIDALKLFSITANFGDVKSLITHPATTTHQSISEKKRKEMGITNSIVRLSIGLESTEALIEDLSQALEK